MKIVAISGMIGTGKTTLCKALSELAGWLVIREDVSKNPFLGPFYEDMERWAFASQLSFMSNKTLAFERCIKANDGVILVDRTMHEDFFVFGSVLRKYQIISDAEHELLRQLYGFFSRSWLPIDVHVYLEDSDENCFQRLLDRGDALESKIELGYVKSIGEEYRHWRRNHLAAPDLEIKSADVDFRTPANVAHVLQDISGLLRSKQLMRD